MFAANPTEDCPPSSVPQDRCAGIPLTPSFTCTSSRDVGRQRAESGTRRHMRKANIELSVGPEYTDAPHKLCQNR
ncbi:hypothetical protein GCM10010424_68310 [Streptomyces lienomycini]